MLSRGVIAAPALPSVLAASAIGATVLPGAPAFADTTGQATYGVCEAYDDGLILCYRISEKWKTNSPDSQTLGTRGSRHVVDVPYTPVTSRQQWDTEVDATVQVWDRRSGAGWQRMRLQQTFKVLDTFNVALSVNWGAIGGTVTNGDTVSATTVYLTMARQAPLDNNMLSRSSSLSFPHMNRASKVEMVSTSTIEYASSNADYRMVSRLDVVNEVY